MLTQTDREREGEERTNERPRREGGEKKGRRKVTQKVWSKTAERKRGGEKKAKRGRNEPEQVKKREKLGGR